MLIRLTTPVLKGEFKSPLVVETTAIARIYPVDLKWHGIDLKCSRIEFKDGSALNVNEPLEEIVNATA